MQLLHVIQCWKSLWYISVHNNGKEIDNFPAADDNDNNNNDNDDFCNRISSNFSEDNNEDEDEDKGKNSKNEDAEDAGVLPYVSNSKIA